MELYNFNNTKVVTEGTDIHVKIIDGYDFDGAAVYTTIASYTAQEGVLKTVKIDENLTMRMTANILYALVRCSSILAQVKEENKNAR